MTLDRSRIWFVIPCKGRLSFLKTSLPSVLRQAGGSCCLVDFDCPDNCGAWAVEQFPLEAASGRLLVDRTEERPLFNKAAAHNVGARRAIHAGAKHLVFMDADVVLSPDFLDIMGPALNRHQFWIAGRDEKGFDERDLFGLLIVPVDAYAAIGGYDEGYEGWGVEDLDMRLQLRLRTPLIVGEVPLTLISGMPHDDALRTQFYREKNPRISDADNFARLIRKLNKLNGGTIPVEWRDICARMWCNVPHDMTRAQRDVVPAAALRAAQQRIQELERALLESQASATWRILRPARKVATLFNRLRHS